MPASTYARFYTHPVKNVVKSTKEAPFFEDVVYAEIFIKGDKNTSFGRPKIEQDEEDYPKAWAAYSKGVEVQETGMGLNFLPNLSPSMQMNLNATGVMTIEDLAELDDSVVLGVQGMVDLRKRAIAYLAAMGRVDVPHETKPEEKRTRRKRNPETGELE